MKNLLCTFIALFLIGNATFADNEPKAVKSEIKDVTVFLSGAQVTRTGSTTISQGVSSYVFEDLSPLINANSIQVTAKGDFTILSVVHQLNYLKTQEKSKEILVLEDSLESIRQQIEIQQSMLEVYTAEESMINANKSIGGQNTGVKAIDFKENADFFRNRLTEIKTKLIQFKNKIKKLQEKSEKINNQLQMLNAKKSQAMSEIVVTVSAKELVNANFTVSYLVLNAGWVPSYDLRAIDVNNPIVLNYKANVYQTTGEDWKKVKLTLSTGNPTLNGSKPNLMPWYLSFANYYNYNKGAGVSSYNTMQPQMARTNASDGTVKEEINANYASNLTTVTETQTNFEFEISIPYTIIADGKKYDVEVKSYTLPAQYEYYCAPKLDRDAFLLAKITGWEEYKLLAGEINLFYEGTYVGKSYLDTRTTKDTLDISLGRDKNIIITRIKLKEFSSSKFIGLNKKETIAWEINVKNNKKQPINIMIEDQFPVSSDKDIEVERLESSGAIYNEETGKLTWKFKLEPGESKKKIKVMYSVKYPKNQAVYVD
ncbi:MAG: mucoidy inhibitor MuiA family protein [Bacteroidetes bacterium]|nr:mucoidy inhibitor MuiA family protein [Bacteroidota bacterium]